mmetsp:Transcript_18924/g.40694  ORF Transcript_18924/g.40694 Transcript_18924/m.40694 type:complete len:203 (-) Transcript_18924:327-935(-)
MKTLVLDHTWRGGQVPVSRGRSQGERGDTWSAAVRRPPQLRPWCLHPITPKHPVVVLRRDGARGLGWRSCGGFHLRMEAPTTSGRCDRGPLSRRRQGLLLGEVLAGTLAFNEKWWEILEQFVIALPTSFPSRTIQAFLASDIWQLQPGMVTLHFGVWQRLLLPNVLMLQRLRSRGTASPSCESSLLLLLLLLLLHLGDPLGV